METGVYAIFFIVSMTYIDQYQMKANAEFHEQMVTRKNSTVCLPVYNCDENTYVKSCKENGTRETCEPCENGEVQPNLISSFDRDEDRQCFRPRDKYSCNGIDTVHNRTPYGAVWCMARCKCNTNNCYWGAPCICNYKARPCGVEEELDVDSGECKPCKQGSYKDTPGCGPCRLNATWFMRNSVEFEMTTRILQDYHTHSTEKSSIQKGLYKTKSAEETTFQPTSSSSTSSAVSVISSEKSKEDEQKARKTVGFIITTVAAITGFFLVTMTVTLACFVLMHKDIIILPCLKKRRRDVMGEGQPVTTADKGYVSVPIAGPSDRISDKEDHCNTTNRLYSKVNRAR